MMISTSQPVCFATLPAQPQEEQPHRQSQQAVRFAADVTVHSIMSAKEYSEKEIKACFYNKMDFKKFKKSSLVTLKLNREGDLPAGHTMRGLECRTREGAAAKKEAKRRAMEAAFSVAPQDMAAALHAVNAPLQHAASVRGMCDELEAREYSATARKHQTSPSVNTLQLQGILDHAPELTSVVGAAA